MLPNFLHKNLNNVSEYFVKEKKSKILKVQLNARCDKIMFIKNQNPLYQNMELEIII